MLIATSRFLEGSQIVVPPKSLPQQLRGFLIQSKAWCLLMSNRAADAEVLFHEALGLLEASSSSRLYLYLLNIYALNCLRLGRIDEALDLENRITSDIACNFPNDYHLTYINALNTARLMRRKGKLDEAESYYQLAFSTNAGVRSESDLVFKNASEAFLQELRGRDDLACAAWVRTACHWLAMDLPEALAPKSSKTHSQQRPSFLCGCGINDDSKPFGGNGKTRWYPLRKPGRYFVSFSFVRLQKTC